ncbi:MAG: nickel pincer cofactor biosynthesis protein LarC [Nitrospirae bacterium]|nr:nickel pincer cofactor biosynthesis protein LarC [Nitrospirota bacterium]
MICYFDCFSGMSGDMILGALVDAGVSPEKLSKALSCLPVRGYRLNVKEVKRAGFRATKVNVDVYSSQFTVHSSRKFKDIEKIVKSSSLSKDIKQKGLAIFKRLFETEAKVHGERFDRVHLHELGAVDCIIDIFGALIGLDILGIKKVYASPLNLGGGTIKTSHGVLSVPAPAAAELLRDVPVYSSDMPFELTTPTGAVLITSLAENFAPMPDMKISKIGIGAGSKDFKKQPNVLRVFIGQNAAFRTQIENKVIVIETNIDDMNPQMYEHVMEILFKAGALDVFLTQVIMKKGRPGVKLTVLCSKDKKEALMKIILKETTSIGLRFYEAGRTTLQREIKMVKTKFGNVRVKISKMGNEILKSAPEYEDCKKIAEKLNKPLIEVMKMMNINIPK